MLYIYFRLKIERKRFYFMVKKKSFFLCCNHSRKYYIFIINRNMNQPLIYMNNADAASVRQLIQRSKTRNIVKDQEENENLLNIDGQRSTKVT